MDLKDFLPTPPVMVCWGVLLAVVGWGYFQGLKFVVLNGWIQQTAEYGHGFVVPGFCLFLLWYRRDMFFPISTKSSLWGLVLLALCAALRWYSAYYFYQVIDAFSLIALAAGLALFLGGWRALRWAWPSIVFWVFALPLPQAMATQFRTQLMAIGTKFSVFFIQVCGIAVRAESNVIHLPDRPLQVVEACSGIRMLMLFFAICVGAAFVLRSPLWQKIVVVASAIPIAIFANVARITLTACLSEWISHEVADWLYHDFAGFLMMPFGLVLLFLELALLDRLFIEPETATARPISMAGGFVPMPPGTSNRNK